MKIYLIFPELPIFFFCWFPDTCMTNKYCKLFLVPQVSPLNGAFPLGWVFKFSPSKEQPHLNHVELVYLN